MSENYIMAVIVPLNEQARKLAAEESSRQKLRLTVWNQAAERIKVLLGNRFSALTPAFRPWNKPLTLPYGVVFGAENASQFLWCYTSAREQQENELKARSDRMRACGKPIFSQQIADHVSVTAMAVDGSDPTIRKEMELAKRFFSDDVLGAAGIYYLGFESTYLSDEQENQILSHIRDYAICMAEFTPLEG